MGGVGGAHVPTTTRVYIINHRASFLQVKSSTVDPVNVWVPGYLWSAQ